MTSDVDAVARALGQIAGVLGCDVISVGARAIDDGDVGSLHAVERDRIESAEVVRIREFASGRALLRSLIRRDIDLPIGPDRRPALPDGIVASLAHDHEIVIAAVAPSDRFIALGVDVEPLSSPDDDVVEIILRPEESSIDPVLAFCLKEAAYKAWSNAGGGFLEHHDVSVAVDDDRFVATVIETGLTLRGRWSQVAGRWIAVVAVAPEASPS